MRRVSPKHGGTTQLIRAAIKTLTALVSIVRCISTLAREGGLVLAAGLAAARWGNINTNVLCTNGFAPADQTGNCMQQSRIRRGKKATANLTSNASRRVAQLHQPAHSRACVYLKHYPLLHFRWPWTSAVGARLLTSWLVERAAGSSLRFDTVEHWSLYGCEDIF